MKPKGLSSVALDRYDLLTLSELARSLDRFAPVEAHRKASELLADRLVRLELVERGACHDQYARMGYMTGYRVLPLGLQVLKYGTMPSSSAEDEGPE
jgi:hypothetical protein